MTIVSEVELSALAKLNAYIRNLSDDEFAAFYLHITTDENGHPDEEFQEFSFEGILSDGLFFDAVVCERDRRDARDIREKIAL